MGISTIASYKGAQIFECLGMADEVVDACFVGTASRIAGVGFETLASDQLRVHAMAYGSKFMSASMADVMALPNPGDYHWRSVQDLDTRPLTFCLVIHVDYDRREIILACSADRWSLLVDDHLHMQVC